MWSVLRRHQGEVYEPKENVQLPDPSRNLHPSTSAATSRCALTLRTIAMHETKPQPKPLDPQILTAPYGNLIYRKIKEHLGHENVTLRRQAISNLYELFSQISEHIVCAVKEGILDTLMTSLVDPDDDMRTQTCIVLELLVKQPAGQQALLAKGTDYLGKILSATDDSSTDVVIEALRVLAATNMAYNENESTKRLIRIGAVPIYVRKLKDSDDGVCCSACTALGKVFDVKEGFIHVIEAGGVAALTDAIRRATEIMVLVEVAEVLSHVAFYGAGKQAAIHSRTAELLIPHIGHESVAVRSSTTAALAALTVSERGKSQAIEGGVVDAIVNALIQENERDVLMNQIKVLANISEHPVARPVLESVVPRLEEIMVLAQDYEPLVQSAQRAIAIIRWIPGLPQP
jgi:hypothetical protein